MDTKRMKAIVFPAPAKAEWEGKAEESLKGKRIGSLSTHTYEAIQLKPLYTREDVDGGNGEFLPGQPDYRRGTAAGGYLDQPWEIANKLSFQTVEELDKKVEEALEGGQTAIAVDVDTMADGFPEWLASALERHSDKAFCVNLGQHYQECVESLCSSGKVWNMKGYIGSDPVAGAAAQGGFSSGEEQELAKWEETLKKAGEAIPSAKTILIDISPYHYAGANAVQELGIALAEAVYYIDKLREKQWELSDIVSRMVFHFQIGSNFFMELAKLRAARLLWNKVAEAYGIPPEGRKMTISAETSNFTKTLHDPYVNLLRAGNEAFAAILGGIQYLSVGKVDDVSGGASSFTERIARNTQLILRDEAHLEKVVDPGGGSWYIEALTKEIAEKAWSFFLEIDARNGIVGALKDNWLQGQVEEVLENRRMDAFTRKQSIIGTNVYAQADEKAGSLGAKPSREFLSQFAPLKPSRLSEPYEELKLKAARYEENAGIKPSLGLLCLGGLKRHKARADFIAGFLAAGGIRTNWSSGIESVEDAVDFAKTSGLMHFCLCGADEQYEEMAVSLVSKLAGEFPYVSIYLAGNPPEELKENLSASGVKGFIHAGSNQYETLSALLKEMEVDSYGE